METEALEHIQRIIEALDYVGVFIFAVTGALVAARHRQDFVTCLFFAFMTGIGGGTTRDLLIGAPVFWMNQSSYLVTCFIATLPVWILRTDMWPDKALRWLDAAGMAAYCAFGALKALSFGVDPIPAAMMGVFTATLGGILRDIVAGQPSILMQREIYVTAAISGAVVTVLLAVFAGQGGWIAGSAGAVVAFVIRGFAIRHSWALPTHKG